MTFNGHKISSIVYWNYSLAWLSSVVKLEQRCSAYFHLLTPWQPISINFTLHTCKMFVINIVVVFSNLRVVTVNKMYVCVSSALDSSFYYFRRRIFIGLVFFHVFVVSPPTWYLSFNTDSGTTAESGKNTVTSLVVVVVATSATTVLVAVIIIIIIIIQFRQISTVLEV